MKIPKTRYSQEIARGRRKRPFFERVPRLESRLDAETNACCASSFPSFPKSVYAHFSTKMNASIAEVEALDTFESMEGINDTMVDSDPLTTSQCGYLNMEKFETIRNCTFWVEGVSMAILGFGAIITNFISIYVFSK